MEDRIRSGFVEKGEEGEEGAFLAGLIVGLRPPCRGEPLEELRSLAEAAGARVLGHLVQRRDRPHPRTLFGRGKVEEIRQEARALDADVVIFNSDLTPGQVRNLERELEMRVVDRSELILDIFARRARTKQARAQVELAQLQYTLPRLRRMWTHLERTEGAIGARGPGETQLETDRRLIQRRIRDLKRELRIYEQRKQREVAARRDHVQVCLVGYTNAGKSTLLNRLTGSHEIVADQLFATLDTRTRKWFLADGRRVLLSDTVGFLANLPHHLVASFQATLEEARSADLLLVVVDASYPDAILQVDAVERVLNEIVPPELPRIGVLNQIDRLDNMMDLEILRQRFARQAAVSACTGEGMEDLERQMAAFLDERSAEITLEVFAGDGRALGLLKEAGILLEDAYLGERYRVRMRIADRDLGRLRNQLKGGRLRVIREGGAW